MEKLLRILVAGLVLAAIAVMAEGNCLAASSPADVARITKEDLKALLGKPDVVVIDVRTERDWKQSGRRITGAVHEDPGQEESWAGKYSGNKTLILYCA